MWMLHPKFRNINPHNVTHFLLSKNPREQMFNSHSLLSHFSPLNHNFVINANYKRSQPTPSHYITCQYVEYLLLLPSIESLLHGSTTLHGKAKWDESRLGKSKTQMDGKTNC